MINNRVNPLYILLLFITLFGISFFQLHSIEKEHNSESKQFNKFMELKQQYSAIKNQKDSFKELEKLLKKFSKKELKRKKTKKSFLVTIESKNLKKFNSFLNSVLKEKFNIKKLVIEKEKIELEIIK